MKARSLRSTGMLFALLLGACARHVAPIQPLHGMQLVPPEPAPQFTLTDQDGKRFSLARAHGQAVALYFGFTHCKDICPQTLARLSKARERAGLTPAQMRIIMVTVDRRRDDPTTLRAFFRKLGVDVTGLTGTSRELAQVYKLYGIGVEPQKNDIAHTDTVFLMDAQGRIIETLVPESSVKDVAADMRSVVE